MADKKKVEKQVGENQQKLAQTEGRVDDLAEAIRSSTNQITDRIRDFEDSVVGQITTIESSVRSVVTQWNVAKWLVSGMGAVLLVMLGFGLTTINDNSRSLGKLSAIPEDIDAVGQKVDRVNGDVQVLQANMVTKGAFGPAVASSVETSLKPISEKVEQLDPLSNAVNELSQRIATLEMSSNRTSTQLSTGIAKVDAAAEAVMAAKEVVVESVEATKKTELSVARIAARLSLVEVERLIVERFELSENSIVKLVDDEKPDTIVFRFRFTTSYPSDTQLRDLVLTSRSENSDEILSGYQRVSAAFNEEESGTVLINVYVDRSQEASFRATLEQRKISCRLQFAVKHTP